MKKNMRRSKNLSRAARVRGGKASAFVQERDDQGQFMGVSPLKEMWHRTKRAVKHH